MLGLTSGVLGTSGHSQQCGELSLMDGPDSKPSMPEISAGQPFPMLPASLTRNNLAQFAGPFFRHSHAPCLLGLPGSEQTGPVQGAAEC